MGLRRVPRREVVIGASLTAVAAGLLLALGPAPGDAPAHLYRTWLVRHGALLWDNQWYAGHYPLASYSLLYYLPAALIGNLPLVVGSAIASTALFVAIGFHEWGPLARWPTRAFGVLAAAPLFTGLYSYSLGFATLLGALRVLQRGRTWAAIGLAALTLGFSPLAFVFLCLILLAVVAAKRRITVQALALFAALLAIAGIELATLILFPEKGTYPFSPVDLAAVLGVCALGALLARRGESGRILTAFFVVWGAGSVVAYLVPTSVGDNWTRLRSFVFPLMLIAAAQARFRPRPLAVVAVSTALLYNLVPYLMLVPYRLDGRPAHSSFWRPAIGFLARHPDPNYRVEVVPTAAHWESYWLPRAGFALARGWYRQIDVTTNPVLYRHHLAAAAYRAWLQRMGVRYVLLPSTRLDPVGGPAEARLLRSGSVGLERVFVSPTWTIYRLADTSPLLTGPAAARISRLGHDAIAGAVTGAGRYTLKVRFNPYWRSEPAGLCIRKAAGGMTAITFPKAERFALRAPHSMDSVLDSLGSATRSRHC